MNTITLVDKWWCCVVPQYRALIVLLGAIRATLAAYVEKSAFDTAALTLPGVSQWYRENQLPGAMGLTPGTFVQPDGTVIEVYYFQLLYWVEMGVFLLTPQATCNGKCKLLTFPN